MDVFKAKCSIKNLKIKTEHLNALIYISDIYILKID